MMLTDKELEAAILAQIRQSMLQVMREMQEREAMARASKPSSYQRLKIPGEKGFIFSCLLSA